MRWILLALMVTFMGACGRATQLSATPMVTDNLNTSVVTLSTPDTFVASIDLRCPAQEREKFIQDAIEILRKFTDTYALASSTSRIALSPIVGEMQALKREMDALEPTDCGKLTKLHLVDAMNTIIDGFLAFMQEKESNAQRLLSQGADTLEKGGAELILMREDPGYGLRPTATPTATPTPTPTPLPPPGSDGVCHRPSDVKSLVGQDTCVCGKVTQSIGVWFQMENEERLQLYVGETEYLPQWGESVMACGLFTVNDTVSPIQYRLQIQDQRYLRLWK